MPKWQRRLFRQHGPSPAVPVEGTLAAELGFQGEAGKVVIDDQWQLAKIEAAEDPRRRLFAVGGFYLKKLANARRGADARSDRAMHEFLDDVCDQLSDRYMEAIGEIMRMLEARGYNDPQPAQ